LHGGPGYFLLSLIGGNHDFHRHIIAGPAVREEKPRTAWKDRGVARSGGYYLLSSAGAFRARDIQLWQWALTKDGVLGGYPRID
jgi:hypothetical protein